MENPKLPILNPQASRPSSSEAPNSAKVKDPVCGMMADPATAHGNAEHKGQTYYFCCSGCETKFKADPEKYLSQPATPSGMVMLGQIGVKPKQETDPVCHMKVDPTRAAGQYTYLGKTYFFCNPRCEQKFKADPERYLHPKPQRVPGVPDPSPSVGGAEDRSAHDRQTLF